MRSLKTAEEAYNACLADGYVKEARHANIDKVKSLMENAETSTSAAEIVIKAIDKQAKEWMSVYIIHYEALRTYTEALLILDKVDIANHQCLFAYLCINHPELELSWDFFEKIRTKRNGANYYGEQIVYKDWSEIELQMKLYLAAIKKAIEDKLGNTI